MNDQPQMMMPMMSLSQAQALLLPPPPQPLIINRGYDAWRQRHHHFAAAATPPARNNNKNWKGNDKRNTLPVLPLTGGQSSHTKARKFYPKKNRNFRFAPYAPRNTTSFIIRAKKSGGIASLVSPSPVTPAVLPTPIFSPSREALVDTAKEEWGVDGYGSMKGLIRLRSPGNDEDDDDDDDEESDVEERVEVERRLDHDLSRFAMVYPNYSGVEYNNVLENRVDVQDARVAQLEEENLTLKERVFLVESGLEDLRRRMSFLETRHCVNEEVVENGSDNDSDGVSDMMRGESGDYVSRDGGVRAVSMEEHVNEEMNLMVNEEIENKNEERMNDLVGEGVVSEKVEGASNDFIMNKIIANKTGQVSSEVGTKIENDLNELVQGPPNAEKNDEIGTSCTENNNTKPVKDEVVSKNESTMQG